MQLAHWSYGQAFAAAGGLIVVAFFLKKWIVPSKSIGVTLGSVDATKDAVTAIMRADAAIEADKIRSVTQLVLWFRDGSGPLVNAKAITLPTQVIDALPKHIAAMTSKQKKVWEQMIVKQRWLKAIEQRRRTAFDDSKAQDVDLLKSLWRLAELDGEFSRKSEEWNLLGFQGLDPTTDLRGGGVLALDHFVSFATHHTAALKRMIAFNKAQLADGEPHWYLTAVVSIQLTVQLLSEKDHVLRAPQLRILFEDDTQHKDSGKSEEIADRTHGTLDGVRRLHHALLLHFAKCWERDLPHVMEYNTYMPKVYSTFFTD